MISSQEVMIEQISQSIFETMFSIGLVRTDDREFSETDPLVVTIHIAGAWTGCVVLELSHEIRKVTAANMLKLAFDEVTSADEQEVASEIVNMIGGNLKGLLPAPSYLSLPSVISGSDIDVLPRDAHRIARVVLQGETGRVRIMLFEKQKA